MCHCEGECRLSCMQPPSCCFTCGLQSAYAMMSWICCWFMESTDSLPHSASVCCRLQPPTGPRERHIVVVGSPLPWNGAEPVDCMLSSKHWSVIEEFRGNTCRPRERKWERLCRNLSRRRSNAFWMRRQNPRPQPSWRWNGPGRLQSAGAGSRGALHASGYHSLHEIFCLRGIGKDHATSEARDSQYSDAAGPSYNGDPRPGENPADGSQPDGFAPPKQYRACSPGTYASANSSECEEATAAQSILDLAVNAAAPGTR